MKVINVPKRSCSAATFASTGGLRRQIDIEEIDTETERPN